MLTDLKQVIINSIEWCEQNGVEVPLDLSVGLLKAGLKSYDYFLSVITRLVKNLYAGHTDELEFVQIFEDLIEGQLHQAWYEGMAQNDLQPSDMTQEDDVELANIIGEEKQQILDFADAIVEAAKEEAGADSVLSRADMWANRYLDVVNQASIYTAGENDRFAWRLGATEHHCATCAALDGVVATAVDWQVRGLHPQQPPNEELECQGWKCDCKFEKTDEPLTDGGIPI